MTPLPSNPKIVILTEADDVLSFATNIAPDVEIVVVHTKEAFDTAKRGVTFVTE